MDIPLLGSVSSAAAFAWLCGSRGSPLFGLAPVVLFTLLADVPDAFILGGTGVALLVERMLVDESAPMALPEDANILGLQARQFLG